MCNLSKYVILGTIIQIIIGLVLIFDSGSEITSKKVGAFRSSEWRFIKIKSGEKE
jgi:hypothetical protein